MTVRMNEKVLKEPLCGYKATTKDTCGRSTSIPVIHQPLENTIKQQLKSQIMLKKSGSTITIDNHHHEQKINTKRPTPIQNYTIEYGKIRTAIGNELMGMAGFGRETEEDAGRHFWITSKAGFVRIRCDDSVRVFY
ncbi:hypothetical protein PV325_009812 [Microctonus aethiopoides]|nr:hypothetical protein PV325_009812 [Microctonus aethiopoides]KAK0097604.1 hypothetical protein PV326_000727 [Microctonus aethiopoides]